MIRIGFITLIGAILFTSCMRLPNNNQFSVDIDREEHDIEELHVVSVYKGHSSSKVSNSYKHLATGLVPVEVNRPMKNAVLVLSSYEPAVWDLKIAPTTTISRIVLCGYYEQSLLSKIPDVRISYFIYSHKGVYLRVPQDQYSPEYENFKMNLRNIATQEIRSFAGQYEAKQGYPIRIN